jgi:hypothetical protein
MHYLDKKRRVTVYGYCCVVPVREKRTWLMMPEFCFHTQFLEINGTGGHTFRKRESIIA